MAKAAPCRYLRTLIMFCIVLLITACLPDLDFMNDPAFRSLMVAMRVLEQPWSRTPLHTESTVESESRLMGEWREAGGNATWTFEQAEGTGCRLTVAEDGYPAVFEATILRLGPHRFLDILYEPPPELRTAKPEADAEATPARDPVPEPLRKVHVFFKLQVGERQVILTPMSQEWLTAGLESGEVDIQHADTSAPSTILEASTEDLRAFVLGFSDDPDAFPGLARGGRGFELTRTGSPGN